MNNNLSVYFLIAALTSCTGNITPKTTDDELNAVKEVVNYYGGHCDYGRYLKVSSDGSKHYYFGLKFSGNPFIGNPGTDDLFAAGLAYKFYSSLKKEKTTFDQIRTETIDPNGGSNKYIYDTDELEKVKSEMPKVVLVTDLLKKQDYDGLVNICDTSYFEDKKMVVEGLKTAEKEYGITTAFRFLGFEFVKNNEGDTELSICGTVTSTIEDHSLKVVTNPKDKSMRIVMFNYKLR